MPNRAPETGGPKTEAKPALSPQITSRHRGPRSVLVAEPEGVGEETGERGADLRRGALLPDRAAERERQHRGGELDRCDEPVDAARSLVHRRDDGLGPVAPRLGGEAADEPDAGRQREREEAEARERAPGEPVHHRRRLGQHPEEGAGAQPNADPRARTEKRPLERADEESGVLGVPAALVGKARGGGLPPSHRVGAFAAVSFTALSAASGAISAPLSSR